MLATNHDPGLRPAPNATSSAHVSFVVVPHKAGSTIITDLLAWALPTDSRGTRCYREIDCLDVRDYERSACPWASSEKHVWRYDSGLIKHCPHGIIMFLRTPVLPSLVENTIAARYLGATQSCSAIFQLRHPFDTLVSMFNSFTATHPPPPSFSASQSAEYRRNQAEQHAAGIDEYVLEQQASLRSAHEWVITSSSAARKRGCATWIARYEDMVEDPYGWSEQFATMLHLDAPKTRQRITSWAEKESKVSADEGTHAAYVHPGAFARMLKPTTVSMLIANLSRMQLRQSGYF